MRKLVPWLVGASCHAYVDVDDVAAHFQLGKARTVSAKDAILQKLLNDIPQRLEDQRELHGSMRQKMPRGIEQFNPKMISLLEEEARLDDHADDIQKHMGEAVEGMVSRIKLGETMDEVMENAREDIVRSGLIQKAEGFISNETKAKIETWCYNKSANWRCPDSVRFGVYGGLNLWNIMCSSPDGCPLIFLGGKPEDPWEKKMVSDADWEILKKLKSGNGYLRWPTISVFGVYNWMTKKIQFCFKLGAAEFNTRVDYDPHQAKSMLNTGYFIGLADSGHLGGFGGGFGLQMVEWSRDGEKLNPPPYLAKMTMDVDFSYKKVWSGVDFKKCMTDNSGCKTSDEAFYEHPVYQEQVKAMVKPKPWENAIVRKQNRLDGYNDLVHPELDAGELKDYLMEPEMDGTTYKGGFWKPPLTNSIYKVELAATPIYWEYCSAAGADEIDGLAAGAVVPTTTTTTTTTETTTMTTTIMPTTSVTSTTVTTTAWWEFYMPNNLADYADRTLSPSKNIADIIANTPSWHPDQSRPTYHELTASPR